MRRTRKIEMGRAWKIEMGRTRKIKMGRAWKIEMGRSRKVKDDEYIKKMRTIRTRSMNRSTTRMRGSRRTGEKYYDKDDVENEEVGKENEKEEREIITDGQTVGLVLLKSRFIATRNGNFFLCPVVRHSSGRPALVRSSDARDSFYFDSPVDDVGPKRLDIFFQILQFVVDAAHVRRVHLLVEVGLESLKSERVDGSLEPFARRNLLHRALIQNTKGQRR